MNAMVKELKKTNKKIEDQLNTVKEAEFIIRENKMKMQNMEDEMKAYQERHEKNQDEKNKLNDYVT
jgi:esterase/lipase